jgi:sulfur relay (sulfurtransferase) DsrF/TusC family protein
MPETLRPMNEMEARCQFINNTPLHQKPWFKLHKWLRYSWYQQWIYDLSIQEREMDRRDYIFAIGVLKQ